MTTTEPATELTPLVYLVDGEPHVGSVNDYAKALEQASYADLDVDPFVYVFEDGTPYAHLVTVTTSGFDSDDYATTTVEVVIQRGDSQGRSETASVRIDGRA